MPITSLSSNEFSVWHARQSGALEGLPPFRASYRAIMLWAWNAQDSASLSMRWEGSNVDPSVEEEKKAQLLSRGEKTIQFLPSRLGALVEPSLKRSSQGLVKAHLDEGGKRIASLGTRFRLPLPKRVRSNASLLPWEQLVTAKLATFEGARVKALAKKDFSAILVIKFKERYEATAVEVETAMGQAIDLRSELKQLTIEVSEARERLAELKKEVVVEMRSGLIVAWDVFLSILMSV
ncbi:hypothetical protein Patl1_05557 [Pistacia atlantica]|uniref:Uncharacterized protein n=1 Tax=Pistacia atlantica TaxID=434234 RepID=A0ACC1BSN0_9ROSI|nr:hypothetical protein Patl1_05557 [Pistacia atlantica]